jgi:signal-transduction protein with cAMP-binding, CBS, and nucleotidyltransferase domain/PAS domain-containing protein
MRHLQPKKIFFLKIDLPALLAVALFAGLIFIYLIPGFEKAMMARKRTLIHEMTSSAYSLLEYYHSLELKGILKADSAKLQAKTAIGTIRYGEDLKDYFWITDIHPRMIVHPYRPDLNGKDLTGFRDSRGKAIFVDFVRATAESGESYVEYMWQWNDDSTRVVPKLSYVRQFRPWNWVIGTGIYIEDVRSEIRRTEFRALIISGIIGIIITAILLAISRQSHRIELKRNKAEEELRKSKELYRTLAEAASEGVLIWSAQGIQANKTLLSWLEYSEDEIERISLREIFDSTVTNEFHDPEILYEDLNSRWFIDGALKTKKGKLLKSHADFSRILLGDRKAVLIVIRPVMDFISTHGFSPDMRVLKDISTGFFRITSGRKNRFINATERTIKLLGFNTLEQLIPYPIDVFFTDSELLRSIRTSLAAKENIIGKEVLLRRITGEEFRALINVVKVESDSQGIWLEGSIEELSVYQSNQNTLTADLNKFSASFVMEAPVSSIMSLPVECHENTPVSRCISIMKENNVRQIIVTNREGSPMGIIDSSGIGFHLSAGGRTDTEVFRWMTSPPAYILADARISEAFSLVRKSQGKCLIVTDGNNRICGIITDNELSNSFFTAPDLILTETETAGSTQALRKLFGNCRKLAVSMILGHADPCSVSLFLASMADAICSRVISLCIEDIGKPPCRFAFIQTGSAGRREQTLLTDQDNAIIFENVDRDHLNTVTEYFLTLGEKISNMLNEIGYRTCTGGNMAGNPEWCQPLNKWKEYFTSWIKMPGPGELLKTSIFFDFRYCYGDLILVEDLRSFVSKHLITSDIYFHYMALAWKQFDPSSALLLSGKTDIKKILMPLTGIIRLYALKHGLEGLSTPDRIMELYSGNFLDHQILRETLKAWKDLSSIRFSHQSLCINKGTDPDNIIDFRFTDYDSRSFAGQAISSINNLILKSGTDFYTEIL